MRRLIPLLLACALLVSTAGFWARSSSDGFVWREVVVLVAESARAPAEVSTSEDSEASEDASSAPPAARTSYTYRSPQRAVARLYIQHCSLLC